MTQAVSQLTLSDHGALTLDQLTPTPQHLPATFTLQQESLFVASNIVSVGGTLDTNESFTAAATDIELIVFSDTTLSLLSRLTQHCQIKLQQLINVNQRIGLTSFRFSATTNDLSTARALLAEFALENNIEAALIKNAPRLEKPGVLVMDMDSTTIKIECIDEIAKLAGVGEQVAEVTERAMQGELDFAQSLHQRVATLAGAPESILAAVANNIPLMEGLEQLIDELKRYNWRVAIASGGFTYFADHLKQLLDLDAAHANMLEIVGSTLTGKVLGDVVDAKAKADTLVKLQQQFAIDPQQTVAMGDGANDLVMMAAAHLGIAFHAKPIVLKQADCAINRAGLNLALHWLA